MVELYLLHLKCCFFCALGDLSGQMDGAAFISLLLSDPSETVGKKLFSQVYGLAAKTD